MTWNYDTPFAAKLCTLDIPCFFVHEKQIQALFHNHILPHKTPVAEQLFFFAAACLDNLFVLALCNIDTVPLPS